MPKISLEYVKFAQSIAIDGRESHFIARTEEGWESSRRRFDHKDVILEYDTNSGLILLTVKGKQYFIPVQGNVEHGVILSEEKKFPALDSHMKRKKVVNA